MLLCTSWALNTGIAGALLRRALRTRRVVAIALTSGRK